jgi:hypothetical protein
MDFLRYSFLAKRTQSINQLNRLHILLENIMTPAEVDGLSHLLKQRSVSHDTKRIATTSEAGASRETLVLHSNQWIESLRFHMNLHGPLQGEWRRRKIAQKAYLFSDGSNSAKRLIICFAGNANRLMMPISFILNQIDPAQNVLAVFRTQRDEGYRTGLLGVSESLEESFRRLPGLLEFERYSEVNSFGTSGGGLPAILAGLYLECDKVLAVGSNAPSDPRWRLYFEDRQGKELGALLKRRKSAKKCLIHIAVGENSRRDVAAAGELTELIQFVRVHRISDASHGCLHNLFLAGHLRAFLESTICNSLE